MPSSSWVSIDVALLCSTSYCNLHWSPIWILLSQPPEDLDYKPKMQRLVTLILNIPVTWRFQDNLSVPWILFIPEMDMSIIITITEKMILLLLLAGDKCPFKDNWRLLNIGMIWPIRVSIWVEEKRSSQSKRPLRKVGGRELGCDTENREEGGDARVQGRGTENRLKHWKQMVI